MERIRERKAEDIINELKADGYLEDYKVIRQTEHYAVILYNGEELKGRIYIVNGTDRTIDIYMDKDWKTGEVKPAEINWSALGTVETEDALKFAQLLQEGAELVAELNKEETLAEINKMIREAKEK